jgi:acyl-CoA synthetase (AMP-forming)/AMP-acid ligase II
MLSGKGTCIGRSVPGVKIKIIKVSDIPEGEIQEVPLKEVGEIAVQGLQVTSGYFEMEEETKKAKIIHKGELWHRMGDLGWMDERGNVWFLVRKVHRVHSSEEVFYPLQMEAIFNQHPEVKKSALIKLMVLDKTYPALVIESKDKKTRMTETFENELLTLKNSQPFTKKIHSIFLHQSLPVDVRHNIKIDRTKLSFWAQDYFEKQSGDLWKRKRL